MDHSESRRRFLKFMSQNSTLIGMSPFLASSLSGCLAPPNVPWINGTSPSFADTLGLAPGLSYQVLCQAEEPINDQGDLFGHNCDFTCFHPLDPKGLEGLLWVNHESVIPSFLHGKEFKKLNRDHQEMLKEQKMVGGSILHIKKQGSGWVKIKSSKYNRRLNAQTPIPFSLDTKIQGQTKAIGTLANCSGGRTPWNTFLTSEENYGDFYGEAILKNGKRKLKFEKKYEWHRHFKYPPEHYGWIVEVDPLTGKAEKQILLGRAPHEGATPVLTKGGKIVVYMGEDRKGGFIYKFVSTGKHFKEGTLYAADTVKGQWLALDIKNPKLSSAFKNQLQVLTYAHQSAELVGATPQDRPEDIQVHPKTGDVFVALTKNPKTGNKYGSLLKIRESGDHDSQQFNTSTWVSCGPEAGLACPDNLCFDKNGDLWVTVDISERLIGSDDYKMFGNNGLFYIPMEGPQAGKAIQIASAPVDAEFTGPWFSPDHQTLFLSVQHPGLSAAFNGGPHTSHWPGGGNSVPKASVVTLQGPLFKRLFS